MAHKLLLTLFVLALTFYRSTATTSFTEHPTDVSVREGDEAVFRCGTDLPCSFFYWGRYQASTGTFSYISKCLSSYESQYDIEVEGNVYSLLVHDVILEDSGTVFECWQYNQKKSKWLKSTNATLTVLPVSTGPEPPVCRANPPGPHAVGDQLSLECHVPTTIGGKQSVVMNWKTSRNGTDFGIPAETATGLSNTVKWTLTEQNNFEEFVCTAGPEPNGTRCSVTPLAIPTNVTISPGSLALTEGEGAAFQCRSHAVPDATSYTWLITIGGVMYTVDQQQNTDHTQRFIIDESGTTLRVVNASLTEKKGAEVVCEASNDLNIRGRSLPATLYVTINQVNNPSSTKSTLFTSRGKHIVKGQDNLSGLSHMTLVIGIMLCVVVLFIAVGMGLLYVTWRRRMNEEATRRPAVIPSDPNGTTFSLHDPEADFRRGSLGGVRACAVHEFESSPLQQFGSGNENEYTEVVGNHAHTSAPAHERAIASEPIYERHF